MADKGTVRKTERSELNFAKLPLNANKTDLVTFSPGSDKGGGYLRELGIPVETCRDTFCQKAGNKSVPGWRN